MKSKNVLAWLLIALAALGLVAVFHRLGLAQNTLAKSVFAVDYVHFFSAAFHADEPYEVPGFYNPFWIFALTALAELFGEYDAAVWVTLNLCAFVWVCVRLKLPLWLIVPFVIFSGGLMGALVGNVEGLTALGLVLPSPVGLILLMVKPQIGATLAAFYVLQAWVQYGWKRAALMLTPVLILFAVSFVLHGAWFLKAFELVGRGYNTIDYFPLGLPLGAALVVAGVARGNVGYALMAIPFTSPYMIFHTWAFPFLGVALVLYRELAVLRSMARFRIRSNYAAE